MTEQTRVAHRQRLREDTNEHLVDRFVWYVQNFNPVDDDRIEDYELVKAELFRRMGGTQ